jgi:hypothetical protein
MDNYSYMREMELQHRMDMQMRSMIYATSWDRGIAMYHAPPPLPTKPKLLPDICNHKPVTQNLVDYYHQLIDYYKQSSPEIIWPVEEGAGCCLKCVVQYYKKLK